MLKKLIGWLMRWEEPISNNRKVEVEEKQRDSYYEDILYNIEHYTGSPEE